MFRVKFVDIFLLFVAFTEISCQSGEVRPEELEELKPVKESEPLKPVKESEELKPVKESEPLKPVKESEPLKPVKESEELKPVKESEPLNPLDELDPRDPFYEWDQLRRLDYEDSSRTGDREPSEYRSIALRSFDDYGYLDVLEDENLPSSWRDEGHSSAKLFKEVLEALSLRPNRDTQWPPTIKSMPHMPIKEVLAVLRLDPSIVDELKPSFLSEVHTEPPIDDAEKAPSSSPVNEVNEICPPGFHYEKLAHSCYKVVYEEHNWTSADQRCRELHPNAHLVAITTSEEKYGLDIYLVPELAKHDLINRCTFEWSGPTKLLWTSGQRLDKNSCSEPFVWKISNDTTLSFSYTAWIWNEPNCAENMEKCVHLVPNDLFYWNDLNCDAVLCPLCEYDPL